MNLALILEILNGIQAASTAVVRLVEIARQNGEVTEADLEAVRAKHAEIMATATHWKIPDVSKN